MTGERSTRLEPGGSGAERRLYREGTGGGRVGRRGKAGCFKGWRGAVRCVEHVAWCVNVRVWRSRVDGITDLEP
jgi:hypothetical protein